MTKPTNRVGLFGAGGMGDYRAGDRYWLASCCRWAISGDALKFWSAY